MKCSACRHLLGRYQDGRPPESVAAQIRSHLAACVGCRAFAEEMMLVEDRLSRIPQIEPATDFTRLVMSRIAALPAPAARRSRVVWLGVYDLVAWAVILALTATGLLHWQSVVAQTGALAAKFAIAGDALYRVADHFHLTTLALVGGSIEGSILLIALYAGWRSLTQGRSAYAGVGTT